LSSGIAVVNRTLNIPVLAVRVIEAIFPDPLRVAVLPMVVAVLASALAHARTAYIGGFPPAFRAVLIGDEFGVAISVLV
jgi:hypothetical protein